MKRKGQYLAVEAIMTVGIGLSLAIGTINLFTDYRDNVLDTGEPRQVNIVKSQVTSSLYTLDESDQGFTTVELPNKIGGSDYKIAFQEGLKISTNEKTYTKDLNNLENRYNLTGTSDGGSVKIFKDDNEISMEAG